MIGKDPSVAAYYAYEFAPVLNGGSIVSVASVSSQSQSTLNALSNGSFSIVGTRVLVLWDGGISGETYVTKVRVNATTGSFEVDGLIPVGTVSPPCPPGPYPPSPCPPMPSGPGCYPSFLGDVTTIPVFGGPTKGALVERAYGFCGQAAYEFQLEPEENQVGLRALNDQMAILGPLTGYNAPDYGDGSPADESGLQPADVLGASYYVAQLLAPTIGKQLVTNKIAARACDIFLSRCTTIPTMGFGRNTIAGSGNKRRTMWGRPFLRVGPRNEDRCQ